MSRQAEYQKRMRDQGRCQICGKPEFVRGYCELHHEQRMARLRERSGAGGTLKTCSHCGQEGHNRRGCPVRRLEEQRGVLPAAARLVAGRVAARTSDSTTRMRAVSDRPPDTKVGTDS